MRSILQQYSNLASNFERLQAIEDKLKSEDNLYFSKKIAAKLKQI